MIESAEALEAVFPEPPDGTCLVAEIVDPNQPDAPPTLRVIWRDDVAGVSRWFDAIDGEPMTLFEWLQHAATVRFVEKRIALSTASGSPVAGESAGAAIARNQKIFAGVATSYWDRWDLDNAAKYRGLAEGLSMALTIMNGGQP